MRYELDEAKSLANRSKLDSALVFVDDREDCGELREVAIGFIGISLHCLVFTRHDDAIRVISLRRATNREKRKYVNET